VGAQAFRECACGGDAVDDERAAVDGALAGSGPPVRKDNGAARRVDEVGGGGAAGADAEDVRLAGRGSEGGGDEDAHTLRVESPLEWLPPQRLRGGGGWRSRLHKEIGSDAEAARKESIQSGSSVSIALCNTPPSLRSGWLDVLFGSGQQKTGYHSI
jgi:hypothetical protein